MKRIPKPLAVGVMSIVCALFLLACNDNHHVTVTGITVAPMTGTINAGGTLQFTATESLSDGTTKDVTTQVTWNSSSNAVATISAGGLAAGASPGTTMITAALAGLTSPAVTLTVNGPTKITVTPATATINAGATQQFTATATFAAPGGGTTTQDVSALATWVSSHTNFGTVNSTGLATAVATGSTTITATYAGAMGSANLTVNPPVVVGLQITPANPTIAVGTTSGLSAVELLSDNTTKPTTGAVTWVSADTTKATVGNTTGIAVGVAAGSSVVTASEGGTTFTGMTTVTVQTAVARFAYLANNSNVGTDEVYAVSTTTPFLTSSSQPAGSSDLQLIVHPSGHFVYTINGINNIVTNTVNSTTGAITNSGQPLQPAGGNSGFGKGVIDPTGQFLFVANGGDTILVNGAIYVFKIDQKTGTLAKVTGSPFTTNVNIPADVLVDKQSKYLYVINNGGNNVSSYTINAVSGALTPAAQPTILTGTGPQYSTIDPSGTRLYVTNNIDNTVSIFSGVDTGVLTQIGAAKPIPLATSVANVAIDPANKFIYVVNSLAGPSTLYAFALNADGTFGAALNGGTTYPLGSSPMGIAIDPTGKILAVDNNFSGNVSVYPINADGTLGTVSTVNTVKPTSGPQFIAFYSAVSGQ